jgi:flagellin
MVSINTNAGLNTALRNFGAITINMEKTGDRISTGFKVIGPKDDASNFAVAQGTRADIKAYQAVDQSLSSASGLLEVTLAAGKALTELNMDIKKKLIELANPANTTTQQSILHADLLDMVNVQTLRVTNTAFFNGRNQILVTSSPVDFVADIQGGTITVPLFNIGDTYNPLATAAAGANTQAGALAAFGAFDAYDIDVKQNLGATGSIYKQVLGLRQQNTALVDALTEGLGAMVDADLARESARFQAQQTQQTLASQSLSIATSFVSVIRGLFA